MLSGVEFQRRRKSFSWISFCCSRDGLEDIAGAMSRCYKAWRIPDGRSFHAEKFDRREERSTNRSQRSEAEETLKMKSILLVCVCSLLIGVQAIGRYRGLEFLEPCSRRDYNIENCLARSANALTEHFRHGKKFFFSVEQAWRNNLT